MKDYANLAEKLKVDHPTDGHLISFCKLVIGYLVGVIIIISLITSLVPKDVTTGTLSTLSEMSIVDQNGEE